MHLLWNSLHCQSLKTVLWDDFCQQFFQTCFNRVNQYLLSVARYLNQMVVDSICTVWALVGFVRHRPILAKEGGFLHLSQRLVPAAKNFERIHSQLRLITV